MKLPFDCAEEAARVLPRVVEWRRALHRMPEAGLELPLTSGYIERELRALGLEPERAGSALRADIGSTGPLVAIRADTDALPVEEATGLEFASARPGFMHACGHDAHAAALLGVAAVLVAHRNELPFRVRLVFQPGEEGFFGALGVIEAGFLDGVDAIVGAHVGDLSEEIAPGQAGFLAGPMMAASDRFEGRFVGSGGHGSAPHRARDPVPALARFILDSQEIAARELAATDSCVVSVCSVSAGEAHNVIPDSASFRGTARTLRPDSRTLVERRLAGIGAGIAATHNLAFEWSWLGGYPPLVNDERATRAVMEAAAGILGKDSVVALRHPIMGGEDFAYYLERVPGCFWFLDTQAPARGIDKPNHNPRFDVDESLLGRVVSVNLAAAAALAGEFGKRR
ncbi:MAG: amidohydrolase [Spirochaetales bacterium]|nr:amidohydrolase [Spirochaetales bacterium]